MQIELETKKSVLSSWLLFGLFFLLILAGFFSEFFQAPSQTNTDINKYRQLFSNEQLARIKKLELKNSLGQFLFEKQSDDDTPWQIISPRNLPANGNRISLILDTLKQFKIKKIYSKDKINIANFSLDNPLLEVILEDEAGLKTSLKLGLVNPIDNSTYAMLNTHQAIYHINAIPTPLSTWDLSNFVDSRIFTFNPKEIASVKVYRGPKVQIAFKLQEEGWKGKNGHPLDPNKVFGFLSDMTNIRSNFILDKVNEKLDGQINKYLETPAFKIEVEDKNKKLYTYNLSGLVGNLDTLKLEKWQNFLITATNRKYPYLLNRSMLKKLNRNEKGFRSLQFKKLFY